MGMIEDAIARAKNGAGSQLLRYIVANKNSRRLIGHAEYHLANAEFSLQEALKIEGGLADMEKAVVGNALRSIEDAKANLHNIKPQGR